MKLLTFNSTRILLLAALTAFTGCNEDEPAVVTEQEEVQMVNESTSAESTVDEELQAMEIEIAANPEGGRQQQEPCVVVTRDAVAKTVTLDFGDGCVGPYGRERSGKIIVTYSGTFNDATANRVISFDNYFVNGKKITGTIELRDFNTDDQGNPTATRKRNNLTVHFPNGNMFTVNGSTTITWLEGFGDADPTNNVFTVTGSYQGESSRGRIITHTILEPLTVSTACALQGNFARVSGSIQVAVQGLSAERVRTIDYGDGECDKTITVEVNGKTYTVTIS